ncbi:hypothetical protein HYDPIDRAFT_28512 [Hydnomerulius pinastri MD-312]|uniref:DUF6699 domain-containing protein n=1 Tax=Hydnomerulius pinastri MD-312 TaxID=994086 RepID=A0A0C9W9S7_9AGAM|nr:hypothetical protein HYDPIDRAFT_28512 [Hydnomerulius pinastri MD-312]
MFKQKHSPSSPTYVPSTPKFTKLSLPEETGAGPSRPYTRADMRRPPTPAVVPTSSRANPTSGQPTHALKSILKGSNNSPPRECYDSESETMTSKKVPRCGVYGVPNVAPPGMRLVPMKPPAFDLHWQLLPYDQRRSRRRIRFDMAFPVGDICFSDQGYRTKLANSDLDKPAANGLMTKMLITFEKGPFSWEVDVKRAQGIRCRDVFEAIYDTFNEQLTLEEQRLVPRAERQSCHQALRLRCKLVPALAEVEYALGLKRVDVMQTQTIFLGLTQPKSGGDWVLNLGPPPLGL